MPSGPTNPASTEQLTPFDLQAFQESIGVIAKEYGVPMEGQTSHPYYAALSELLDQVAKEHGRPITSIEDLVSKDGNHFCGVYMEILENGEPNDSWAFRSVRLIYIDPSQANYTFVMTTEAKAYPGRASIIDKKMIMIDGGKRLSTELTTVYCVVGNKNNLGQNGSLTTTTFNYEDQSFNENILYRGTPFLIDMDGETAKRFIEAMLEPLSVMSLENV